MDKDKDKEEKVKKRISEKEKKRIQEKRIASMQRNRRLKKEAEEKAQAELEAKQKERDSVLKVDLFQEQIKTLKLYQDCFDICRKIVDDAKENPLDISASKLQVIMRMMNTSQDALKQLEQLQAQQAELDEIDPDSGMTSKEKAMVEDFEKIQKGIM